MVYNSYSYEKSISGRGVLCHCQLGTGDLWDNHESPHHLETKIQEDFSVEQSIRRCCEVSISSLQTRHNIESRSIPLESRCVQSVSVCVSVILVSASLRVLGQLGQHLVDVYICAPDTLSAAFIYGIDTVMSSDSTSSDAAPASPDYVPGPEELEQAPLSPDYVSGPEYPEYLAPYDEEVPIEDQPYVVADSPIALSSSYVADSDPEEDLEEDSEDGLVDYPADGGNGDDDDSSDIYEEEEASEEEEKHLAPADSVVAPVVDHVPSFEETELFEIDEYAATPLSLLAYRTTARISIRPEAPMPFPSEEEVKRLLALPPSPLISLSPPSAEEHLARCLAAPALPSSPLPIVPHPYGSPNHVRAPPGFRAAMGRLRASSPSTHHPLHSSPPLPPPPSSLHLPPHVPTSLPLPSSPLPQLSASLFIPPPVNRKEDITEAKLPPCKRLCLTALTSRYEVEESSNAAPRPTRGHGIDYGFIGTLDAETRRYRAEEVGYRIRDVWVDLTEAVEEVALTTLEGVNARVIELTVVQEQDTQDIYDVIEDTQDRQTQTHTRMQDFRIASQESLMTTLITHVSSLQGQLSAALGQIQALQARDQTHTDDHEGAASTTNNMPPRRSSATARAAAAATPMTAAAVEQLIKARVSTELANHETLRNSTNGQGDGSHNSDTGIRGTGTEGVVVLSQCSEKMESVFHISNCAVENQVKFATCTFFGNALTWWNSHMKTVTQDVAYALD
ncbi:hypothetical protein Tco_0326658 [Tanacetum coccineum]